MNVSLTSELEKKIQERVESGLYQTASEVVREGMRFFFEHEPKVRKASFMVSSMNELQGKIQEAIDQLGRGEGVPGEEAFKRLRARAKARRGKHG